MRELMKTCEECKREFYSKPYDHREAGAGQIGYCINCPNSGIKEREMEFDKSRVYTAVNADELKPGDKVVVADNLTSLKNGVAREPNIASIMRIRGEDCEERFCVGESNATGDIAFSLAYLVERKENCTNCLKSDCECSIEPGDPKCNWCEEWQPKTTEKMYRPFKDTDELIKVWDEKTKPYRADTKLPPIIMPLIWVKWKESPNDKASITAYGGKNQGVFIIDAWYPMFELLDTFTFLDGSPCGVEE